MIVPKGPLHNPNYKKHIGEINLDILEKKTNKHTKLKTNTNTNTKKKFMIIYNMILRKYTKLNYPV